MTEPPNQDEPCDLKHRTVTNILAHTLIQLVSLASVFTLAYYERINGEWALGAILAIGGFQLQQLVKGKPPTSLVFAVVEGVRHVTNKFA